jgi:hypothetical protein
MYASKLSRAPASGLTAAPLGSALALRKLGAGSLDEARDGGDGGTLGKQRGTSVEELIGVGPSQGAAESPNIGASRRAPAASRRILENWCSAAVVDARKPDGARPIAPDWYVARVGLSHWWPTVRRMATVRGVHSMRPRIVVAAWFMGALVVRTLLATRLGVL